MICHDCYMDGHSWLDNATVAEVGRIYGDDGTDERRFFDKTVGCECACFRHPDNAHLLPGPETHYLSQMDGEI